MRTPAASSTPVKAWLVNCEPWSVLKISGLPRRARSAFLRVLRGGQDRIRSPTPGNDGDLTVDAFRDSPGETRVPKVDLRGERNIFGTCHRGSAQVPKRTAKLLISPTSMEAAGIEPASYQEKSRGSTSLAAFSVHAGVLAAAAAPSDIPVHSRLACPGVGRGQHGYGAAILLPCVEGPHPVIGALTA
jgi:hypothetical protein